MDSFPQTNLSCSLDVAVHHFTNTPQVNDRISSCLADISTWMASHHPNLNLNRTELLFFPYKTSLQCKLSITVDDTTVTASHSAKSLGVVLDDQLDLKEHIKTTSRSCRFLLHNIRLGAGIVCELMVGDKVGH
ncbi:hypothetical protein ANANG_G00303360 [Anguilla anguilla]|uniref:Uncharacterized protein n=1 Tax=Anguilla anguilla TaxID=7936 RepID=A0A9D3RKT6_ANGAN|nr:hypothetical protein ANANG_G00303360 [Anguilla anguilla]